MYFIGTFVFQKADTNELIEISALIYSLGGLFFLISGVFVQKRYFLEKTDLPVFTEEEFND